MAKLTTTDVANNLQKVAEGRLNRDTYEAAPSYASTFIRMIVMDVVTDPNVDLVDDEKINIWHSMGVSNMQYASLLPRNTIIAKRVGEEVNPMFVFPFFPSHISLPCKPGECVWAMLEKPEVPNSDMAFWMSRVIEPHTSDDVNHSHPGRMFEISLAPTTKERADNQQKGQVDNGESVFHELRNGPVVKKGEERVTASEGTILLGEEEDIFERLVLESNAAQYVTYEAVPRFRKRPSDIAFEGSNNTLIVLGTDRSGSIEKSRHEQGSIDLVAGRGQINDTFGLEAPTTSIFKEKGKDRGEEIKRELNKSLDVLKPNEGDPDFKNDRSRVLISQRTSTDEYFGLKSYNKEKFDGTPKYRKQTVEDDKDGDAAIVIKSDKVRLIARSDIEIVVTGFEETLIDPPGKPSETKKKIKAEKTATSDWASIVIKKNGDIVISPSNDGFVKLGGDDADLAVLCSKVTTATSGKVIGQPLVDTIGGAMGVTGNASTGEFATKILIK